MINGGDEFPSQHMEGRFGVGEGVPFRQAQRKALGGVWRSADSVTESRMGTDGRRAGGRRE